MPSSVASLPLNRTNYSAYQQHPKQNSGNAETSQHPPTSIWTKPANQPLTMAGLFKKPSLVHDQQQAKKGDNATDQNILPHHNLRFTLKNAHQKLDFDGEKNSDLKRESGKEKREKKCCATPCGCQFFAAPVHSQSWPASRGEQIRQGLSRLVHASSGQSFQSSTGVALRISYLNQRPLICL